MVTPRIQGTRLYVETVFAVPTVCVCVRVFPSGETEMRCVAVVWPFDFVTASNVCSSIRERHRVVRRCRINHHIAAVEFRADLAFDLALPHSE